MIDAWAWIHAFSIVLSIIGLLFCMATSHKAFKVITVLSIIMSVVSLCAIFEIEDKAEAIYTTTSFEEIYKGNDVYYIKSGNEFYEIKAEDIGVGDSNLLIKKTKPEIKSTKYYIIVKDMAEIKDFKKYQQITRVKWLLLFYFIS